MRNTSNIAFTYYSVAATRVQVHPLPVQIQRCLTRGKNEKKSPEGREREKLDKGMHYQ